MHASMSVCLHNWSRHVIESGSLPATYQGQKLDVKLLHKARARCLARVGPLKGLLHQLSCQSSCMGSSQ